MLEGVAVVLGEGALGGGTDVGEDQAGTGFGSDTFEIHAVPGGQGGGEDTGCVA